MFTDSMRASFYDNVCRPKLQFLLLELMPLFFTTPTPSLPEILVVTTAAADVLHVTCAAEGPSAELVRVPQNFCKHS